jgi:hypothetical protein
MTAPPFDVMMLEGLPVSVDPLKTKVLAPSTCTAKVAVPGLSQNVSRDAFWYD